MHYSIIPNEYIFSEPQKIGKQKIEIVEIKGLKMEVERINDRQFKIIRLITTDPSYFLLQEYNPGQIITGNFNLEKS